MVHTRDLKALVVTYERPTQEQDRQNDRMDEGGLESQEAPTLVELLEVVANKIILLNGPKII